MTRNQEGLTSTYNRFHNPDELSPDILELRKLHAAMDDAVLQAYGWDDLSTTANCEFLLDYEEEGDEVSGGKSKKKKPWRLRWPDDFRDEVLARLLELNQQRHQEELLAGKQAKADQPRTKTTKSRTRRKTKQVQPDATDMYANERYRFYVLMLLRAWDGKAISRRLLNDAMLLMVNDIRRQRLLKLTSETPEEPGLVLPLPDLLASLDAEKQITIDNSGMQQLLRVGPNAVSTDNAPEEDLKRLAEVKEYLAREAEAGKVSEVEGVVDGQPNLVPVG